ncbi:MAG: hypothetical protein PWP58_1078 [Bacillota bacterium]|jgi:hypothetical protein|nr:hypothetical protein [Bacillota bacterium]
MIEERLRQAFKQPGCPICAAVQEAHDTFYRWFVIETYGELPLLEDLSRGGFCEYHAWETARVTGRRLSFTYEFLVASEHHKLQKALSAAIRASGSSPAFQKAWGRRELSGLRRLKELVRAFYLRPYRRAIKDLQRTRPCPVCRTLEETEVTASHYLLRLLDGEAERSLYAASDGLCLPHLHLVLKEAEEPEIAVFLLRDALKRLDILRAGFEEYFRKEDYRFAHEPKGVEQETWLKAVERFAGRSRVPYWLSGTPQSSRNTKEPS